MKPTKCKVAQVHTTLSGTPGGGNVRFFGGGPLKYDLLSKRHSPILPYVSSPWKTVYTFVERLHR